MYVEGKGNEGIIGGAVFSAIRCVCVCSRQLCAMVLHWWLDASLPLGGWGRFGAFGRSRGFLGLYRSSNSCKGVYSVNHFLKRSNSFPRVFIYKFQDMQLELKEVFRKLSRFRDSMEDL